MTKHSQETIERVARIVAEALGDTVHFVTAYQEYQIKANHGSWSDVSICGSAFCAYLSDHQTVARYFKRTFHIWRVRDPKVSPKVGDIRMDRLWTLWEKALLNPLGAIITLVEKMEEGKEQ